MIKQKRYLNERYLKASNVSKLTDIRAVPARPAGRPKASVRRPEASGRTARHAPAAAGKGAVRGPISERPARTRAVGGRAAGGGPGQRRPRGGA